MNDDFNFESDRIDSDNNRSDSPDYIGRIFRQETESEGEEPTTDSFSENEYSIELYSSDRGGYSGSDESADQITLSDILENYYASGEGESITLSDVYASLNNITKLQTIGIFLSLFYLCIVVFRNVASKFKRGV